MVFLFILIVNIYLEITNAKLLLFSEIDINIDQHMLFKKNA